MSVLRFGGGGEGGGVLQWPKLAIVHRKLDRLQAFSVVTLSRCFSLERVPSLAILLATEIGLKPDHFQMFLCRPQLVLQVKLWCFPYPYHVVFVPLSRCEGFADSVFPTFPKVPLNHYLGSMSSSLFFLSSPVCCFTFTGAHKLQIQNLTEISICTCMQRPCLSLWFSVIKEACAWMYVCNIPCGYIYVCMMAICAVISLPVFHEDTHSTVYVVAGFVI